MNISEKKIINTSQSHDLVGPYNMILVAMNGLTSICNEASLDEHYSELAFGVKEVLEQSILNLKKLLP